MIDNTNDIINFLKNKKVAIFGMGVSGLSAARFLKALKADILAINKGEVSSWAHSSLLDYVSLKNCFQENDVNLPSIFKSVDLLILSPGISRDHPLVKILLQKNIPVWGEIELAYRYLESTQQLSPIIGVTGTNGKTTTTTFLGEMIKNDQKKVFVGGNIGVPFCDYTFSLLHKKDQADFILLELSSFQLESIDRFHVNVAIILNIYPNHGERYSSIEDYASSKFFITNRFFDDDLLIYPEDFALIANWAKNQKGKKKIINTKNPSIAVDISHFKLPGVHNLSNLQFVLAAALSLGISSKAIDQTISSFRGVHHRIELVNDVLNLPQFKVFNDAKSTNWDATITAVLAMENIPGPLFLIIGGKKRGHGDSILPYLDLLKQKVYFFYLIGEMALELEQEMKGKVNYENVQSLEKMLEHLKKNFGQAAGILLLSPAFPSFDQFSNYAQRGEFFMQLLRG